MNKNQTIKLNKINQPEPSTQVKAHTASTQNREGQRSKTLTFISAKDKTEQINSRDSSNRAGERRMDIVKATMRDDVPEQRVLGAKLVDDDPAQKMEEDKMIEEMVQWMERELDKEFKDFALENVMGDTIVTTATIPTKAETEAATATKTVTTTATSTTASEVTSTAAVAAATSIGATTRGAVTAAADPTRVSKAELPL